MLRPHGPFRPAGPRTKPATPQVEAGAAAPAPALFSEAPPTRTSARQRPASRSEGPGAPIMIHCRIRSRVAAGSIPPSTRGIGSPQASGFAAHSGMVAMVPSSLCIRKLFAGRPGSTLGIEGTSLDAAPTSARCAAPGLRSRSPAGLIAPWHEEPIAHEREKIACISPHVGAPASTGAGSPAQPAKTNTKEREARCAQRAARRVDRLGEDIVTDFIMASECAQPGRRRWKTHDCA